MNPHKLLVFADMPSTKNIKIKQFTIAIVINITAAKKIIVREAGGSGHIKFLQLLCAEKHVHTQLFNQLHHGIGPAPDSSSHHPKFAVDHWCQ
jgi:hypothetical protein